MSEGLTGDSRVPWTIHVAIRTKALIKILAMNLGISEPEVVELAIAKLKEETWRK